MLNKIRRDNYWNIGAKYCGYLVPGTWANIGVTRGQKGPRDTGIPRTNNRLKHPRTNSGL